MVLCTPLNSFAQLMVSEQTEWQAILNEAKANHKSYVFLDAYTDWCGWCKVMDQKTFSDSSVFNRMNTVFVTAKIEMEKTETGRMIAMKYGINSFPTFLIFNTDGRLVYKLVGYHTIPRFQEALTKALNPENQFKKPGYADGFISYPTIYKQAFAEKNKRAFADSAAFEAWYATVTNLADEATWRTINRYYYLLDYDKTRMITSQKDVFIQLFGADEFDKLMGDIASSWIRQASKFKNDTLADLAISLVQYNFTEEPERMALMYRIHYLNECERWKELAYAIEEVFHSYDKYITDDYLNTYAWNIYEKCTDPEVLNLAVGWLHLTVNSETSWHVWDTYACLLFKTEQFNKAEKAAQTAIKMGKAEDKNVTATETLLKNIQEAQKAGQKGGATRE